MSADKKRPWLDHHVQGTDYVDPQYYRTLLKPYVFDGEIDLDIIRNRLAGKTWRSVLELGCGEGRSIGPILDDVCDSGEIMLVDASRLMVNKSKQRFENDKRIEVVQSDSVEFLAETEKYFDLIFSIWSISTSVHNLLLKEGPEEGKRRFTEILRRVIGTSLASDGRLFVLHYDALSEEQAILMDQWRKVNPLCPPRGKQSPSLQCFIDALGDCSSTLSFDYSVERLVGDPIRYSTMEEALEIFMNFHLSSRFNRPPHDENTIAELTEYFEKFIAADGSICIRPGCFLIDVKKTEHEKEL